MWTRWVVGTFLTSLACSISAANYDLCVRAIGPTFQRTVQVRMSVDGPDLGQLLGKVAPRLINRLVFQERAAKVYVESFDKALCSASLGEIHSFSVAITQAELDRLTAELDRGFPSGTATLSAIERSAKVGPSQSSKPTLGQPVGLLLRIFYATNRKYTTNSDPNERFGNDRGQEVSLGWVLVSIPREHRMGELESPSIQRLEFLEDAQKHIVLKELHPLSLNEWKKQVRERAASFEHPGVILFIHGYNASFAEAAKRTAQLAHDLAFPGPAVFFSWPSRGELASYFPDEQAAEWAIPDLRKVLADLASLSKGVPIYVIAHSMGNRVLTRGLVRLLDEDPATRRSFKEIVLTAPDIDVDVFKRDIAPKILGIGPRVTLYASSNDSALVASRGLHGGPSRLGEGGRAITLLSGMDSIDASSVKTDFIGHSYYGDNRTVLSDLFYLIRTELKPSERFGLTPVHSPLGTHWRFKE